MIAIFFSGRFILFAIYFSRFKDSGSNYWLTFLYGLRLDTIVSSIMLVIPLIILTFIPPVRKSEQAGNSFLKIYFLLTSAILLFIEYATFPFFAEYDVRPNYLFVEYLVYPKEVISMLFWTSDVKYLRCHVFIKQSCQ
jgi:phosphoglycerol transferase MdoB-like AlkP superfamily enzyme